MIITKMIWSLAPVQGLWIFHDVLRFWSQSAQVHLVQTLKRFPPPSICQFEHEILVNKIHHLYCKGMIIHRGSLFLGSVRLRWHLFLRKFSKCKKKLWTGQWMSSEKKESQKASAAVRAKNNENWLIGAFYKISWQGKICIWLISFLCSKSWAITLLAL